MKRETMKREIQNGSHEMQSVRAVDIVRRWAERAPERVCLIFWEGEKEIDRVTYAMLVREVSAVASLFRREVLGPGDPVVLLARSVRPFISAFLAAQQAELLAVPCPPPEPLESGRRVRERVTEIIERCGARALFDPVPGAVHRDLKAALEGKRLSVLTPTDLDGAPETGDHEPRRRYPFAYCQFTSGSGGRAKGVLLTHENLLANIRAMEKVFNLDKRDIAVTWLPLFHDMGLVSYVLSPLIIGYPCHLMSPVAFLAKPVSWLALLSRVRGTKSSAPNFAYALCARKISDEELAGIDLSSWRMAFNGSEPVTREVVEAFIHRLMPFGFDPSAMLPAYGLAEDTVCATSRRPGEGARFDEVSREALEEEAIARPAGGEESRGTVASVGRPLPGHEMAVFDSEGMALGERRVGEIAIRSDSLMQGYLPGTKGEVALRPDGWLLTGDLGYLTDGELFIVGRKKDLIIRAGRNYYPQDLEEAAGRVSGVRPGRAAAFSVPGTEGEQVILVVECREGWEAKAERLRSAIRRAAFAAVRFVPDDVLLLPPRTLPLTSSGKVMRPEARRLYLGEWRSRGAIAPAGNSPV